MCTAHIVLMVNVTVSLYFLYSSCYDSYYMSVHVSDHTSWHTFQPRLCWLRQIVTVSLYFLYASCRDSYHFSVHVSDHIEDLSAKIMSASSINIPWVLHRAFNTSTTQALDNTDYVSGYAYVTTGSPVPGSSAVKPGATPGHGS